MLLLSFCPLIIRVHRDGAQIRDVERLASKGYCFADNVLVLSWRVLRKIRVTLRYHGIIILFYNSVNRQSGIACVSVYDDIANCDLLLVLNAADENQVPFFKYRPH